MKFLNPNWLLCARVVGSNGTHMGWVTEVKGNTVKVMRKGVTTSHVASTLDDNNMLSKPGATDKKYI